MKGFLFGTAALAALAAATGFIYDRVAVDSSQDFRSSPYVHVSGHG